jgi:hypothetical protein
MTENNETDNNETDWQRQALDQWASRLPDEWDTHKLGGITTSGDGVCAVDCEACRFNNAVATKPLTLWYAYIQWEHDILFLAKTKEIAEFIAKTEWDGYPVIIKEMEVTE